MAALLWTSHMLRRGSKHPTTIHIQHGSTGGHGKDVWNGAPVLARFLEGEALRGKRVLELGAGTGLTGIAAAAMGAHVLLTDMPCLLDLLRFNCEANVESVRLSGGSVQVQGLEWGDVHSSKLAQSRLADLRTNASKDSCTCGAPHSDEGYDFIIAADCVYTADATRELLNTLASEHLCSRDTKVILAFPPARAASLSFMSKFRDRFVVERLVDEFGAAVVEELAEGAPMGIYLPLHYNAKAHAQSQTVEPDSGLRAHCFHIHVLTGKVKAADAELAEQT